MAVDESNVRVAITGAVSKGPLGTAAPTGTSGGIGSRTDLGAISEDGVTLSLPDSGEATPIKIWQNGATVRTLRATSDDLPQITFTMVEEKIETVETYFGVTVTPGATEGSFEFTGGLREPSDYLLDVVDGNELARYHMPRGVVSSVGEITLNGTTAKGYQVTIDCERGAAGYNLKGWSTGLRTPSGSSSSSSSSS